MRIEECEISGKVEFKEVDWNPPQEIGKLRGGRGGNSPMISPRGYTALVAGIEKPVPIGRQRMEKLGGADDVKGVKVVERKGKRAWRVPGRC